MKTTTKIEARQAFVLGTLFVLVAMTSTASAADWVSLFDGKSLDGWSIKSGYATYRIEDDAIVGRTAEGSGNTFLCTAQEFGDFELEFEVKVDNQLNSGVQIRSLLKDIKVEGKQTYGGRVYGPQVEIEASPGQAGFIYGEATGRGWLSPEPEDEDPAVNQHAHFDNGAWNHYRVVADGANIKVWINGHSIADLTDQMIYETHSKGMIGLQVHGIAAGTGPYEVRWRNLRIKPLN